MIIHETGLGDWKLFNTSYFLLIFVLDLGFSSDYNKFHVGDQGFNAFRPTAILLLIMQMKEEGKALKW